MIETRAGATCSGRKAGWTRADLTAAINAALPDYLGITDGADVGRLLDTLTAEALRYADPLRRGPPRRRRCCPTTLRLRQRRLVLRVARRARLYATPDQVRTERVLVAATAAGGATALPAATARPRSSSSCASPGSSSASTRPPPSAGCSPPAPGSSAWSARPAPGSRSWSARSPTPGPTPPVPCRPGGRARCAPVRRVFGLATSQIATDVLVGEGLTARNVDPLARHPGPARRRPRRRQTAARSTGDEAWRLHAGDLVVVDESAMTDTAALAAIHRYVEAAGAKLLLVGDHRQLAAIGAGGGMELLAQAGTRYELTEARRFTHEWERDASLRLRDGDDDRAAHLPPARPAAGLRHPRRRPRPRPPAPGSPTPSPGSSSLLLVDDNEQAARLSAQLRAELVRARPGRRARRPARPGHCRRRRRPRPGPLQRVGPRRGRGQPARPDQPRDLPGHRRPRRRRARRPLHPGGRDAVGPDGEPVGQRMVLPADYVAEHLALAYASTVHAAQGRTIDTSHAVVTSWTSLAALYVALSRGRDANTAHVATISTIDDPAQGGEDQTLHRDPVAVLAGILDRHATRHAARSALAIATDVGRTRSGTCRPPAELLADAAALAATERTAAGSTSSPTPATSPPSSGPGSPPRTAPPRSPACCAGSSWPGTTPARSSSTPSPTALWTGRRTPPA